MKLRMPVVAKDKTWRIDLIERDVVECSMTDAPITARVVAEGSYVEFRRFNDSLYARIEMSAYQATQVQLLTAPSADKKIFEQQIKRETAPLAPITPEERPTSRATLEWGGIENPEATPMGRMLVEQIDALLLVDGAWYRRNSGPVIGVDQYLRQYHVRPASSVLWQCATEFGMDEQHQAAARAQRFGIRALEPRIEQWDHHVPPASALPRAIYATMALCAGSFELKRKNDLTLDQVEMALRSRELMQQINRERWGIDQMTFPFLPHEQPSVSAAALELLETIRKHLPYPYHRAAVLEMQKRAAGANLRPEHEPLEGINDLEGFAL